MAKKQSYIFDIDEDLLDFLMSDREILRSFLIHILRKEYPNDNVIYPYIFKNHKFVRDFENSEILGYLVKKSKR